MESILKPNAATSSSSASRGMSAKRTCTAPTLTESRSRTVGTIAASIEPPAASATSAPPRRFCAANSAATARAARFSANALFAAGSAAHSSSARGEAVTAMPSSVTTIGCARSNHVFHAIFSSNKAMVPSRTANGSFSASNASGFNLTFSNLNTPLHKPTRNCSRGRSTMYCPRNRSNTGAITPSSIVRRCYQSAMRRCREQTGPFPMVHPALTRPRPLAPLPALRGVEGGRETSCARGAVWPYRSVREASH